MQFKKLKVRPRKEANLTVCGPQLALMLNCFTAKNDIHGMGPCQDSAKALFDCMRTVDLGRAKPRNTINYHLMRLNKFLK
ncbi:uncharacterized protein B0H18DRAFT_978844 [Fomitopsis serialis]|uniref:uncharacterized protein n=1 Tax=Fomitopsis serialis TaxID=139415 RepID=UPI002008AFF5|nr:uncharacterized protein B0H18DRAFT_978844 [Neoantrodia serialis]KAH9934892.1 hypothetical protein B0H18DRAFT_978844 [Neoantrodia serialis]